MQGFEVKLASVPPGAGFELPFNPREAFARARAPVQVTTNSHSFAGSVERRRCATGGVGEP